MITDNFSIKKIRVYTATLTGEIMERDGGDYVVTKKFLYYEDAADFLEKEVLAAMRLLLLYRIYSDDDKAKARITSKEDIECLPELKGAFKYVNFQAINPSIVNDGHMHKVFTENVSGEDYHYYVEITMIEKNVRMDLDVDSL